MSRRTKFVFVTGGVVSSIGKGLASASIGALMEARGLTVTHMKLDPYVNVDPGTMSPYQHGEVFVTADGAETDLDLGHYERFTSARLNRGSNVTTGRIYQSVIEKERRGEYLGATVQVIPHVTDEIKSCIWKGTKGADIAIVEVGGTVGDIESLPFLEALRQLKVELGPENALSVHVTLVPHISSAGELKTKPTQHSVKDMREIGIQPDILICRCDRPINKGLKEKISLFSNVAVHRVISAVDVGCIYELPLVLHSEGLDDQIAERLNIWSRRPDLTKWEQTVQRFRKTKGRVRIAVVGKYVHLKDTYKSLHEALIHGGLHNQVSIEFEYIDSERLEQEAPEAALGDVDAVLVPGGFGDRGIEGKIRAIQYAREKSLPYFGICLGMQLAVIEFARHVAGLKGASSAEFEDGASHKVIDFMVDQRGITQKGGTMRLGAYPCALKPGSVAERVYGRGEISERHRHRYEVNNTYRETLEQHGLVLSGTSPDGQLVEMVELTEHPYFVGCQFHPEFTSRPTDPHPLFSHFVAAAWEHRQQSAASEAAAANPRPGAVSSGASDDPEQPVRERSMVH